MRTWSHLVARGRNPVAPGRIWSHPAGADGLAALNAARGGLFAPEPATLALLKYRSAVCRAPSRQVLRGWALRAERCKPIPEGR